MKEKQKKEAIKRKVLARLSEESIMNGGDKLTALPPSSHIIIEPPLAKKNQTTMTQQCRHHGSIPLKNGTNDEYWEEDQGSDNGLHTTSEEESIDSDSGADKKEEQPTVKNCGAVRYQLSFESDSSSSIELVKVEWKPPPKGASKKRNERSVSNCEVEIVTPPPRVQQRTENTAKKQERKKTTHPSLPTVSSCSIATTRPTLSTNLMPPPQPREKPSYLPTPTSIYNSAPVAQESMFRGGSGSLCGVCKAGGGVPDEFGFTECHDARFGMYCMKHVTWYCQERREEGNFAGMKEAFDKAYNEALRYDKYQLSGKQTLDHRHFLPPTCMMNGSYRRSRKLTYRLFKVYKG